MAAHGGPYGAGIGTGFHGAGGTVTISGNSKVTATGGLGAAGIGGGTYSSMAVTISGSATVIAKGGSTAAGIGGGGTASGESIAISGGTVTAQGGSDAAGIGGGLFGSGGTVTVSGSSNVTATAGATASAIGSGGTSTSFGSLTNAGTLTLKGNETIPSGFQATNGTSAVIHLDTELHGGGTLVNQGAIQLGAGGSLTGVTVTDHDYVVTYTVSGTSITKPASQTVYAASFSAGGVTLPSASPNGWSDSGAQPVTDTTDLATLFGERTGATSVTLYPTSPPAPPTITSFAPPGTSTLGGTHVTIRGTNLTNAESVEFGSTYATFHVTGPDAIVATAPATRRDRSRSR